MRLNLQGRASTRRTVCGSTSTVSQCRLFWNLLGEVRPTFVCRSWPNSQIGWRSHRRGARLRMRWTLSLKSQYMKNGHGHGRRTNGIPSDSEFRFLLAIQILGYSRCITSAAASPTHFHIFLSSLSSISSRLHTPNISHTRYLTH